MRTNRAFKQGPRALGARSSGMFRRDRAEVGVGTLIVFIAMVLVAAVAAAVLINTTGVLQQRAQATGRDATQDVSSNLKIVNVFGHRNDTTTSAIHKLRVVVQLSAGSVPMDLTQLLLRMSDGASTVNYAYGYGNGDGFNTTWVRGTNGSAVMKAGDLVEIEFHAWALSTGIATRTPISLALVPGTGSAVIADFKTPSTYASDKIVALR